MHGTDDSRQTDVSATEWDAVAFGLRIDALGWPAGHLPPVFLGNRPIVLPAKSFLLFSFMTLERGSLWLRQLLPIHQLAVSTCHQIAVHATGGIGGRRFWRRIGHRREF